MNRSKRTTWSSASAADHHLLRGRGVTTTGRKASTRAAHRSVRGQDLRGVNKRRSDRAAA